ncbi:transcription antitermination factor NusB [Planctomycetota bacterium]|nr:transcription antitermination factor NusB [Planctomycetota bacterium]
MNAAGSKTDNRTEARELTLKLLYALDANTNLSIEEVESILDELGKSVIDRDFARIVFNDVKANLENIDGVIQEAAQNWQVSRMPAIDRAVVRLATAELLYQFDIPPKVSINEAVNLVKKFSTAKSGSFVNGVLDKIYQTQCPEKE